MAGWPLEPVLVLPAETAAEAIRARLAEGGERFAVLTDEHGVRALVDGDGGASGSSLVIVDGAEDRSGPATVWMARRLGETAAAAIVVLGADGTPAGAIPREVVASAATRALSGGTRMYGRPDVAPVTFVCRECDPPSYRRPLSAASPTRCPVDFRHGEMQPES